MKRTSWIALALLVLAALMAGEARAHGGKSHRLLGTVVSVVEDRLVLDATSGKRVEVRLTAETRYERDGKAVERSALVAGARVSVHLTEDDATAVLVKVGAAPKSR